MGLLWPLASTPYNDNPKAVVICYNPNMRNSRAQQVINYAIGISVSVLFLVALLFPPAQIAAYTGTSEQLWEALVYGISLPVLLIVGPLALVGFPFLIAITWTLEHLTAFQRERFTVFAIHHTSDIDYFRHTLLTLFIPATLCCVLVVLFTWVMGPPNRVTARVLKTCKAMGISEKRLHEVDFGDRPNPFLITSGGYNWLKKYDSQFEIWSQIYRSSRFSLLGAHVTFQVMAVFSGITIAIRLVGGSEGGALLVSLFATLLHFFYSWEKYRDAYVGEVEDELSA